MAALAADGLSEVSGMRYVDRGYERVAERLRGLGARVELAVPKKALTATGTYGS